MKTIDNKRRDNSRFFGDENHSGKKILWSEGAVRVRFPSRLQSKKIWIKTKLLKFSSEEIIKDL